MENKIYPEWGMPLKEKGTSSPQYVPCGKTIQIHPDDIIAGAIDMHDRLGRYDLLGQILASYNIKVHQFSKSPASQNTILRPFSIQVRGEVNNTPLCLAILKNASLPALKQIELANDLLEEYDIQLESAI